MATHHAAASEPGEGPNLKLQRPNDFLFEEKLLQKIRALPSIFSFSHCKDLREVQGPCLSRRPFSRLGHLATLQLLPHEALRGDVPHALCPLAPLFRPKQAREAGQTPANRAHGCCYCRYPHPPSAQTPPRCAAAQSFALEIAS